MLFSYETKKNDSNGLGLGFTGIMGKNQILNNNCG
jgi:hypothetical protein